MAKQLLLSLGSNVGDRFHNLRRGVELLAREVAVLRVSSIYETEPVGVEDQPRFLNIALSASSSRDPEDLLAAVKAIEREVGRRPTFRWGPRVLDIDILLYGDIVIETEILTIPHPQMVDRAFVLVPAAEIAPEALHPVLGQTIEDLSKHVGEKETIVRAARWST